MQMCVCIEKVYAYTLREILYIYLHMHVSVLVGVYNMFV